MASQPHHRGRRYNAESARLRRLANANPNAICWRDGMTKAEHEQANPAGDNRWTAGHTVDGSTTWRTWAWVTEIPEPGDWLAPEIARCNIAAENDRRRGAREPHHEEW